jgi:hypothetical protein
MSAALAVESMTTRKLRRILIQTALAAVPFVAPAVPAATTAAVAVGAGGCCGDYVDSHTFVIEKTTPAYADLIAACAADDLECEKLCTKVLMDAGFSYVGEDPEESGDRYRRCVMRDHDATHVELLTTFVSPPGGCGRRPAGLLDARGRGACAAAAYLAAAARMEAASVHAFARLARDLNAHGAPAALVRAAVRAATDEVAHAAAVAAHARRLGATVEPVAVEPRGVATLGELAAENAVEGGVHETFGVVLALHQSRAATDRGYASAIAAFAADETEHAALAAAIDAWARPALTRGERAHVRAARAAALAALPAAAARSAGELDAEARALLGLPAPDVAAELARALVAQLAA